MQQFQVNNAAVSVEVKKKKGHMQQFQVNNAAVSGEVKKATYTSSW